MCLTVYLASDTPLPLVPWKRAAPGFYVSDRVPDSHGIQLHVMKPYVHLVGTHTGCGCGFLYEGVPQEGPEHADVRAMYLSFAAYLKRNVAGQSVEIYSCWGGDERAVSEHRGEVDANEIGREGFAFLERQLLKVHVAR